jgi:hypothetical protein
MSEALGWHRDHIESLLRGEIPPTPAKSRDKSSPPPIGKWEEIAARLANIERRLDEIDHKIAPTPRSNPA